VRHTDGYAPHDLTPDPVKLGLSSSTATNEYGTAVAWSTRTNHSPRATIFLHGAAGSWTTWTPLLHSAADLGTPIENPVLLDLPGWGDGVLTDRGRADVLAASCSLVTQAAEQLGYTEWDLVGHSMGGFIALHLAATNPQSVLSVGAISPTSWSIIDAVEHPVRRFTRLPAFLMLWRVMQVLGRFGLTGSAPVRALSRVGLLRFFVGPLFRYPRRVPPLVIAALAMEVRPRAFSAAVSLIRSYNADARWSRIECPVRATQGDRDVFARASDLHRLGRVVPSSQRSVIPDSGHFALIERPREVLVTLGFAPDLPGGPRTIP
jgi:pimeloyl-ACP methyl ester carboxylesterase